MLCETDANQLFFMSEKHVSMANVIFFHIRVVGWEMT